MRVAVIALHYGKEYLAWAVRGVQDAVDEIHVHYTRDPSYGFRTALRCPDSEEKLSTEALRFANKPVRWLRVEGCGDEGAHRMQMDRVAREAGAEMYLVVDADEIWSPTAVSAALDAAWERNCAGRWLARFVNFWRSFRYQVDDSFRPVRIVDCRHPLTVDAYLDETMQPEPVYHFGYAQSLETMRYKMAIHGHRNEFRVGWFEDKFTGWKLGDADCHPVVNSLWTPRLTTPSIYARVCELLHDHPYMATDLIA